jgi:LuxR family transcriptional regulator, positive regulator of biofilm formation
LGSPNSHQRSIEDKAIDGHRVYIIGPRHLQNALLAYYLEKETGCPCSEDMDSDRLGREAGSWVDPRIILRDSTGIDPLNPWFGLGIGAKSKNTKCILVLFNHPPNMGYEKKLAELGVRGVFYESDPLGRFKKGIPAILEGELWFSRDVMIQSFVKPFERAISTSDLTLTKREKEILLLIAAGASNDEVAQQLYISLHTVKNHVSRIYNKLKVDNRLQAALWAASHL